MAEKAVPREAILTLRRTIARIENDSGQSLVSERKNPDSAGFRPVKTADTQRLPLGVADLDAVLEGGWPLAGLTEIRAQQTRDAGAASGFVLALAALCQDGAAGKGRSLPVLWVGQGLSMNEAGTPYAVGLQTHGVDAAQFVLGRARSLQDALWITETALSVPAFAGVVLEVRGNPAAFGLTESRRLHIRARASGIPLFLLRQGGCEEASSALFRLCVGPAPAAGRRLPDGSVLSASIGNPVFRITVEKSRLPSPPVIFMEWNPHDRRFQQLTPDANAVSAAYPVAHFPASAGRQDGTDPLGRVVAFKRAS